MRHTSLAVATTITLLAGSAKPLVLPCLFSTVPKCSFADGLHLRGGYGPPTPLHQKMRHRIGIRVKVWAINCIRIRWLGNDDSAADSPGSHVRKRRLRRGNHDSRGDGDKHTVFVAYPGHLAKVVKKTNT